MMFGYHRQYDTGLLLLAVPACALLAQGGGRIGRLAVGFTFAAALASSDIVIHDIGNFTLGLRTDHAGFARTLVYALIGRPVPWAMLALAVFYECLNWRGASAMLPVRKPNWN